MRERASQEVERLVREAKPSGLSAEVKREMTGLMEAEARKWGMERLPERED